MNDYDILHTNQSLFGCCATAPPLNKYQKGILVYRSVIIREFKRSSIESMVPIPRHFFDSGALTVFSREVYCDWPCLLAYFGVKETGWACLLDKKAKYFRPLAPPPIYHRLSSIHHDRTRSCASVPWSPSKRVS